MLRFGGRDGPLKKVEPGTVKCELTALKKVIDHRKRKLGLLINPLMPSPQFRRGGQSKCRLMSAYKGGENIATPRMSAKCQR